MKRYQQDEITKVVTTLQDTCRERRGHSARAKATRAERVILSILALLALACCFLVVPVMTQQTPQSVYFQFDGLVIRSDRSQPLLLQMRVTGSPTRVVFEYNPSNGPSGQDLEMRDDGTGGDQVAGDGIYSVTLQASQVIQGLQPDDVFRRFIGFIKLFQGSTLVSRLNILAQIITDEIPRLAVTSAAQDVQYTNYLVNIFDSGFYSGSGQNYDYARVTKRFYQLFRDDYDFLNIVFSADYSQNRFHVPIKNNVQGIGTAIMDNASFYGSSGKLLGVSVFPPPSTFDGAESGYQHELGHQWINFLRVAPLQSGIPHWPISSLASGTMGYSLPPTGEGVRFPCYLAPEPGGIRLVNRHEFEEPLFTDMDLYFMGLLPVEQVGEHLVFADQDQARTLQCNGQLFTGDVLRVRGADIVNAVGPRIPNASSAPKRLNIATIIVSRDGLLSEEAMAYYSFFARRAEGTREVPFHLGFVKSLATPFAISTGGRGSINTQINLSACSYTLSPTSQFFETSASAASVSVTAGSACSWTVAKNASWIAITAGASGSGNGAVNISIASNMNGIRRSGTLLIAGQTLTITQAGQAGGVQTSVSAASYSATGLARESIAAAFGSGLARATLNALGLPLRPSIAGTIVRVRDSAGVERLAPLFFVSPTQINFQVPAGTSIGTAVITVTSGDGTVSTGSSQIAAVAPGLFSANSDGQGVAAAYAVRVRNGVQTIEDIFEYNAALNKLVARPLDLGPSGDVVVLVLFGTGIKNRSSPAAVSCLIGGENAVVEYASSAPRFIGLDQVNAVVPRNLAGRGEVEIALTVDGKSANVVKVSFR